MDQKTISILPWRKYKHTTLNTFIILSSKDKVHEQSDPLAFSVSEPDADLITAAVNGCASINPKDPLAAASILPLVRLALQESFHAMRPHYQAWGEATDIAIVEVLIAAMDGEDVTKLTGGRTLSEYITWIKEKRRHTN